jgi:hypothetical protein
VVEPAFPDPVTYALPAALTAMPNPISGFPRHLEYTSAEPSEFTFVTKSEELLRSLQLPPGGTVGKSLENVWPMT